MISEMFSDFYEWAPRSMEYFVVMMLSHGLSTREGMPLLIDVPATFLYLYTFFQMLNHLRPSMRKKHGGRRRFWAYA